MKNYLKFAMLAIYRSVVASSRSLRDNACGNNRLRRPAAATRLIRKVSKLSCATTMRWDQTSRSPLAPQRRSALQACWRFRWRLRPPMARDTSICILTKDGRYLIRGEVTDLT